MELIGDGQYVAPVIEAAQLHARLGGAATYVYSFNYPSRLDAYPRWASGVHGDDLMFVFGAPLTDGVEPFPSVYSRSDRTLAETVLKYWTNFIRTGYVIVHGGASFYMIVLLYTRCSNLGNFVIKSNKAVGASTLLLSE